MAVRYSSDGSPKKLQRYPMSKINLPSPIPIFKKQLYCCHQWLAEYPILRNAVIYGSIGAASGAAIAGYKAWKLRQTKQTLSLQETRVVKAGELPLLMTPLTTALCGGLVMGASAALADGLAVFCGSLDTAERIVWRLSWSGSFLGKMGRYLLVTMNPVSTCSAVLGPVAVAYYVAGLMDREQTKGAVILSLVGCTLTRALGHLGEQTVPERLSDSVFFIANMCSIIVCTTLFNAAMTRFETMALEKQKKGTISISPKKGKTNQPMKTNVSPQKSKVKDVFHLEDITERTEDTSIIYSTVPPTAVQSPSDSSANSFEGDVEKPEESGGASTDTDLLLEVYMKRYKNQHGGGQCDNDEGARTEDDFLEVGSELASDFRRTPSTLASRSPQYWSNRNLSLKRDISPDLSPPPHSRKRHLSLKRGSIATGDVNSSPESPIRQTQTEVKKCGHFDTETLLKESLREAGIEKHSSRIKQTNKPSSKAQDGIKSLRRKNALRLSPRSVYHTPLDTPSKLCESGHASDFDMGHSNEPSYLPSDVEITSPQRTSLDKKTNAKALTKETNNCQHEETDCQNKRSDGRKAGSSYQNKEVDKANNIKKGPKEGKSGRPCRQNGHGDSGLPQLGCAQTKNASPFVPIWKLEQKEEIAKTKEEKQTHEMWQKRQQRAKRSREERRLRYNRLNDSPAPQIDVTDI